MTFIWNILLLSIAIFLVTRIMPKIHIESIWTIVIVALVYSLINTILGGLLVLLTLPLMVITLGLFKLVINATMLWITDKLIAGFEIEDVATTAIAALLITVIDSILRLFIDC